MAVDRIFAYKLTFIILSVIFVGVQIIGVLIGVFRSFAGTQSKEAAGYISGFSSASEFAAHHELKREQVARDAEAQLSSLQERIEHRHALGASTDRGSRRSFALYVREAEQAKARSHAENESKRLQESQRAEQAELDKLRREVALQREREAILAGAASQAAGPVAAAQEPVAAATAVIETAVDPVEAEQQASLIASLGDLTQYTEAELSSIASELGVDGMILLSKQKVQAAIKRAKAGA